MKNGLIGNEPVVESGCSFWNWPAKLCAAVENSKIVSEMEEEELLSPDEIRKIENELEFKLANMTLEDLEESSGSV